MASLPSENADAAPAWPPRHPRSESGALHMLTHMLDGLTEDVLVTDPSVIPASTRCWRFRLPDRLEALPIFNEHVERCLAEGPPGTDSPAAASLRLVLDELLTNVIKYAHPGDGSEHEILVQLCLADVGFALYLEDDGVPFDPTAPRAGRDGDGSDVPLEDRAVGGWGLAVVRGSVDEVTYWREDSKNKLIVRKGLDLGGGRGQ